MAKAAVLADRAAIRVSGEEAPHFLHNLVTSSVETLVPGEARYGALLMPQGKIISDFFVLRTGDGYLLDVPAARAADLTKRLTLYRLRAKVTIEPEDLAVAAIWDAESAPDLVDSFADPRLPELGYRVFLKRDDAAHALADFETASEQDFHAHRVGLGVPQGGRDFRFDDAFPHEADMDQLNGVDFRKGCYIGQEVVSRTQHRGTARTRIVPVRLAGSAAEGAEITAGERVIGTLGSVSGGRGMALIRLDRAEDALAAGEAIRAGSGVLTIERPHWARFRFPGDPLPETAS